MIQLHNFIFFFVLHSLKNFLKILKDFFGSAISIDHFGIVFGCNLFSFFIVDNNSFFNSIFSIIKIVSEMKKIIKGNWRYFSPARLCVFKVLELSTIYIVEFGNKKFSTNTWIYGIYEYLQQKGSTTFLTVCKGFYPFWLITKIQIQTRL